MIADGKMCIHNGGVDGSEPSWKTARFVLFFIEETCSLQRLGARHSTEQLYFCNICICVHVNTSLHPHMLLCMCFPLTAKTSVPGSECFSMHSQFSSLISSEEAAGLGCKAWVAVWVMACKLFRGVFRWIGEGEDFTQEYANSQNFSHHCAVLPDT